MSRGRPKVISDELYEGMKLIWPEVKTRRSILNKHYVIKAWKALKGIDGVEYLISQETGEYKESILIELGRLESPDKIRELALMLCDDAKKEKKPVHYWAKLVRSCRLLLKETVS